jgi:hypothetical protein
VEPLPGQEQQAEPAAIALLTKRRWLEWGMFGVAGLGLALGAAAAAHL